MSAGAFALLLSACASAPSPRRAVAGGASQQELTAAIAADSRRSDVATDSATREQLAADAGAKAQACLQADPMSAACLYYQGVSLGLEARAHPLRANELLKSMLESLAAARTADPAIDDGGPDRVTALVLVRAPGWPLGPGDPDAGLAAARRAVALRPQYPPNLLALAEALAKTGDPAGAHAEYQRARDVAQAAPPSAERDEWLARAAKEQ